MIERNEARIEMHTTFISLNHLIEDGDERLATVASVKPGHGGRRCIKQVQKNMSSTETDQIFHIVPQNGGDVIPVTYQHRPSLQMRAGHCRKG